MRNLAGRRFSATSRYHDSALRIDGSSQIVSLAKSPMGRLLGLIYPPTVPASISTHIRKRLSPLPLEYAQQVRIVDTVAPQMLGVAAPASSLNSHRSSERHCHQTRRCCGRRHDRFALHQSALAPENLTTLAHFLVSSAMSLPKSVDESASGVLPRSAIRALILGSARPALISRLSLSITSTGVFLGAPMPYHALAS